MNNTSIAEDPEVIAQAAEWQVASSGDGMDWDGFTTWLEADARHRQAFDEIAATDRLVSEHRQALSGAALPEQSPTGFQTRKPISRWFPLGFAAAAILAIVAGPALIHPGEHSYATGASPRTIALAGGSQVKLAPHSRLVIAGNTTAMQLSGGAWFDVRHVASRELAITAGPVTIRDIGTRFDVQADGSSVRVAVAEGHVEVASTALSQPIALGAGGTMMFDGQNELAKVGSTTIAEIGGWRQNRLSYDGAPLALVVDDLGRYAGIHLGVPASLRSRRFSGTLIVGTGIEAPRDLAQLMGLALVCGPDGLRLAPRSARMPSR